MNIPTIEPASARGPIGGGDDVFSAGGRPFREVDPPMVITIILPSDQIKVVTGDDDAAGLLVRIVRTGVMGARPRPHAREPGATVRPPLLAGVGGAVGSTVLELRLNRGKRHGEAGTLEDAASKAASIGIGGRGCVPPRRVGAHGTVVEPPPASDDAVGGGAGGLGMHPMRSGRGTGSPPLCCCPGATRVARCRCLWLRVCPLLLLVAVLSGPGGGHKGHRQATPSRTAGGMRGSSSALMAPYPPGEASAACDGYSDPASCGCAEARQSDYRGPVATTASGRKCERWDSRLSPGEGRGDGLEGNRCRNPRAFPGGDSRGDRAWCYVAGTGSGPMAHSAEWEYCDIPDCVPPRTASPRPSASFGPSGPPTGTQSPSGALTLSRTPSRSAGPSAGPSVPPTWTGGCVGLAVSVLLPPQTFTEFNLTWRVSAFGKEGEESKWEATYDLGGANGNSLANTIVTDEAPCLSEGDYTFGVSNVFVDACEGGNCKYSLDAYWSDGLGVNNTWYVLSSEGKRILCGDILPREYPWENTVSFHLPFRSTLFGDEGEPVGTCHGVDEDLDVLKTLQCYYAAFNYSVAGNSWTREINRDAWSDGECEFLLDAACKHSRARETSIPWMRDFCALRECESYGAGSCGCLFDGWNCQYGSGCAKEEFCASRRCTQDLEGPEECDCQHTRRNCYNGVGCDQEAFECCERGGGGCECGVGPRCEGGDWESCTVYADRCCEDDWCRCSYLKDACTAKLEDIAGDMADSSLLSMMKGGTIQECEDAEMACCKDLVEVWWNVGYSQPSQCGCGFWGPLCSDFSGPICDLAAGKCCGSPAVSSGRDASDPYCYCEFYHYAYDLGHPLEENTCDEVAFIESMTKHLDERYDERYLILNWFFRGLGGDHWFNKTGWGSNAPECQWFGVSCRNGLVSGIDLRGNNLTGRFRVPNSWNEPGLRELEWLDLSGNQITGNIGQGSFYRLRNLERLDLSRNCLSGEVDVLVSPSVNFLNLSHNKFTSIARFQPFKRSYETLKIIDLSYNNIRQNVLEIMQDIPVNLMMFNATGNSIQGTLPTRVPALYNMRFFLMNNNMLSGTIPDFSRNIPFLTELNLSKQSRAESRGLSGPIPRGLFHLPDLVSLDLSHNDLTSSIPHDIGKSPQLRVFNVSNNRLSSDFAKDSVVLIPTEIGKLAGILEVFDASNNMLKGRIPTELGSFKGLSNIPDPLVLLSGNKDIVTPAPLSLCSVEGFDLKTDSSLCPPERDILKEFHDLAKGFEWTESAYWLDEYISHCNWTGVTCVSDTVTELNLTNNGLSGKLSKSIAGLHSLKILDLNDNNLKGAIPSEIGSLSNLTHLRLSYNSFVLELPAELGSLNHLQLVHLHGNRLLGAVPEFNTQKLQMRSSFIADCGLPTHFEDALYCPDCTICCNLNEECHSTEQNALEQREKDYTDFLGTFCLILLGYIFIVVMLSSLFDRHYQTSTLLTTETERSMIDEDKKYAINTIGADSVYSFFLSKYWFAWAFALAVVALQILALCYFVMAAGTDFSNSNERSDFVYSWRCPRNSLECTDESDVEWHAWLIFGILMASHLLKDIVNGLKLLMLSGKQRHSFNSKMRFFLGGTFLTVVSAFTIYASAVYNIAIARSNTEVIMNAVIILFVIDMDEQFYAGLVAASSFWGGRMPGRKYDETNALTVQIEELRRELQSRDEKLETCLADMRRMCDSNDLLQTRLRTLESLMLPHSDIY